MARLPRVPGFTVLRRLGAGRTGATYLAVDKETGDHVAIKTIARGARIDRAIEREVLIHATLRHPHIVPFRSLRVTPTHLAMVLDACKGGDLFDFVTHSRRALVDEPAAWRLFAQILDALRYLHDREIYHRDLKPENVLLSHTPTTPAALDSLVLQLCDFGFAIRLDDARNDLDAVGTTAYAPPEVFDDDLTDYDLAAADCWSATVIFYVILAGRLPFCDPDEDAAVFKRGSSTQAWYHDIVTRIQACRWNPLPAASPHVQDLFRGVFRRNPADRLKLHHLIHLCTTHAPIPQPHPQHHDDNTNNLNHNHPVVRSQSDADLLQILTQSKASPVHSATSVSSPHSSVTGSNPNLLGAFMASMHVGVRASHSSPQLDQMVRPSPTHHTAPPPRVAPVAMQRVATAGEDLHQLYLRGLTFEKSNRPHDALPLFRAAAEMGHTQAQVSLGSIYENGNGVDRNVDLARDWYSRAASRGSLEGKQRLEIVRKWSSHAEGGEDENTDEAAAYVNGADMQSDGASVGSSPNVDESPWVDPGARGSTPQEAARPAQVLEGKAQQDSTHMTTEQTESGAADDGGAEEGRPREVDPQRPTCGLQRSGLDSATATDTRPHEVDSERAVVSVQTRGGL